MNYLQNGVEVKFSDNGKIKTDIVNLVDYSTQGVVNNEFLIVNQYSMLQNDIAKRPDIIVFLNGFPIIVIELKSCNISFLPS